jgi:hypothetical protein
MRYHELAALAETGSATRARIWLASRGGDAYRANGEWTDSALIGLRDDRRMADRLPGRDQVEFA